MRRQPIKRNQVISEAPKRCCRDCSHSYDWQNRSFNGSHLILCRCKYDAKSKYGKFCKFLSDKECEHFQERQINAPDNAKAD